jgi:multicomponent Na+:H+ antiporter subunit A
VVISVGVGLFAAVFAFLASGPNPMRSVSEEMSELALPEAGGRNIVNVILTDFRALDTLGEITVVAVAAIGILALVRPGRAAEGDEE